MKIALIAGHGFSFMASGDRIFDAGATNTECGVAEHEVCSEIVRLTRDLLSGILSIDLHALILGHTLQGKIDWVNILQPDLAVEVHLNASTTGLIRGTEVLHYPSSVYGKKAARVFQNHLIIELGTSDRGLKPRSDLIFLRETKCPSIITEAEFLSNDEVALSLKEGWLIRQIAWAHAKAIWELSQL